ncbi:MAG: DUF523 domain-containing protein [Desulfotomaculaceae bacterium]|nr:DUF523 domain-containing protein [Desulfotomaculaceae bacterium]
MIIVSSCLLGVHAKYDGTVTNKNDLLMKYSHLGQYLPFCPEQLGGLTTPRPPVETINGTAINSMGEDVTSQFKKGAEQSLYLTEIFPIKAAILKERSPSCGVHKIYDGSFSHVVREGQGVTAAILIAKGIPVYSEEDLTEELLCKLLCQGD